MYEAFVWNLLYGCEEIITSFSDQYWDKTCRNHLERHIRYLCEVAVKQQLPEYEPIMQNFLIALTNAWKGRPDTPECS
jgi:hypothetical protein